MSAVLTIEFDLPEQVFNMTAFADFMEAVHADLGALAHAEILRLVYASGLRTTIRDYVHGLQPPDVSIDEAVIVLKGVLPNMIEQGWGGGDLRETLLMKNAKRKQSAAGHWYASIPFSHGMTSGPNTGGQMPPAVAQAAKQLMPTLTWKTGPTMWGESLPAGMSPKAKPHHATDLHAGMYRMQKAYGQATQHQYRTFRTISSKPDPTGKKWMHPGIRARNFFDQAADFVEEHADAVIASRLPMLEG